MPRIPRSLGAVLGLAPVLALLAVASLAFPPRQFYPLLHYHGTLQSITVAGFPVSDARLCEERLARLRTWLPTHAGAGQVQESCPLTPNRTLAELLSTAAVTATSLRLADAVVLFEDAGGTSGAADCEALIERLPVGTEHSDCLPAGAPRPFLPGLAADFERLRRGFALACGAAALMLFGVVASALSGRLSAAFALSDALWLLCGLLLVTWTRNAWWAAVEHAPPPLLLQTVVAHAVLTLVMVTWLGYALQHYTRRRPFWDELSETLRILFTVFLLACTLSFLARLDAARGSLLLVWGSALVLIPSGRGLVRTLLKELEVWERPAVIIGIGVNAAEAVQAIRSEANLGYRILGFLRSGLPGEQLAAELEASGLPLLGPDAPSPADIVARLSELGSPQVVVAVDSLSTPEASLLIQHLSLRFDGVHVIPTIRGLPLFGTSLSHFFRHEVLFLTLRNTLQHQGLQALKRSFDVVASAILLLLLSPLLAVLALLIWRSGGSPLFAHPRVGRDRQTFSCLKFRSMRPDAEQVLQALLARDPAARAEWAQGFKLRDDPRITPIGRFLRRTSLDELPQLWNVLRGDMSMVGPRPIIQQELERYGDQANLYLQVRPGLTGLWQVSGRSDTDYAERVALDTWYVQNWSLWYDIAILFKTIDTVLQRRGAY